jgi:hypothetical protein
MKLSQRKGGLALLLILMAASGCAGVYGAADGGAHRTQWAVSR